MTEGIFDFFSGKKTEGGPRTTVINPDGTITLGDDIEILPDNAS